MEKPTDDRGANYIDTLSREDRLVLPEFLTWYNQTLRIDEGVFQYLYLNCSRFSFLRRFLFSREVKKLVLAFVEDVVNEKNEPGHVVRGGVTESPVFVYKDIVREYCLDFDGAKGEIITRLKVFE